MIKCLYIRSFSPSVEADEVNYTLDEWKSLQGAKSEPKFNIRKPGEGSEIDPKWKKTTVYKKEKEVYNDDDDEVGCKREEGCPSQ